MLIRPHDRGGALERGDIDALALDATANGEYAIVPLDDRIDGMIGRALPFRRWLTIDEYNGYVWCSSIAPRTTRITGMYEGANRPANEGNHRIVVASLADATALIEALTYAAEGRLIPPI